MRNALITRESRPEERGKKKRGKEEKTTDGRGREGKEGSDTRERERERERRERERRERKRERESGAIDQFAIGARALVKEKGREGRQGRRERANTTRHDTTRRMVTGVKEQTRGEREAKDI